MKAPRLSHQLVLEAPHRSPDGAGGHLTDWTVRGMHWAELKPASGRERAASGMPTSHQPIRIYLRAAPVASDRRPVPGQRFRSGTRLFEIEAVTEMDPEGRYLICRCKEELAT